MMVGNSLRSDVLPVLSLGGRVTLSDPKVRVKGHVQQVLSFLSQQVN